MTSNNSTHKIADLIDHNRPVYLLPDNVLAPENISLKSQYHRMVMVNIIQHIFSMLFKQILNIGHLWLHVKKIFSFPKYCRISVIISDWG